MANCANHPIKRSVAKCKLCGKELCLECRMMTGKGVFCSEDCSSRFGGLQQSVIDDGGPRRRGKFSIVGAIKTTVIAVVLLAVIWYILTLWLGTSNPSEMPGKIWQMIKVLF